MSTPVLLQNILHLQSSLQRIQTASSYFYDVKASSVVLDPIPLATVPPTEVPYFVVGHRVDPLAREILGSRSTSVKDRYRITIEARVDANGLDTARKITAMSWLCADVEKALLDDQGHGAFWGFTRGGLAMETLIQQPILHVGLANQNQCFVEIPVEIVFRRDYGQP